MCPRIHSTHSRYLLPDPILLHPILLHSARPHIFPQHLDGRLHNSGATILLNVTLTGTASTKPTPCLLLQLLQKDVTA